MRNKLLSYLVCFSLSLFALTGCAGSAKSTEELVNFRTNVDNFCDSINQIDNNINNLNLNDSNYSAVLLENLNQLNDNFKSFADLDFPKDYDYLELLADEASDYMNTAVNSYSDIFENNYTEDALTEKYNYATENYTRAYKRIQIIVTFLNGETSEGVVME